MEAEDREILAQVLARPVGEALSAWVKKNGIDSPVTAVAALSHPTLFIDEKGVPHNGPLVTVDVSFGDDCDDEDDY